MKKLLLPMLLLVLIFAMIPQQISASSQLNGFDRLKEINEENQVIIVNNNGGLQAVVTTYEKVNGEWRQALPKMSAVVGNNGISTKLKEGDGITPTGVYTLGTAFGWGEKPNGVKLPYRTSTSNDYWIDDPASSDYNKWITYSGNPTTRWNSYEKLKQPLYKYAVAINYNTNPIVKGKGSAIFLHVWRSSTSPTAGCVALAEENVTKLLTWIDPAKKPIIVIGKTSEINTLLGEHALKTAKKFVADAQMKANKLRGNYDASSINDVEISPQFSSDYSAAKTAVLNAQEKVNSLQNKQELQQGLDAAKTYQLRAAYFIDAVKVGQNEVTPLKEKVEDFVQNDSFTPELAESYHELSAKIKKDELLIGKVYGSETREFMAKALVMEAKIIRETVIYEVSIFELLHDINELISQNQQAAAIKELAKLDRLKKRAIEIKDAGNKLHPGKYPDLPGMKTFLEKYEEETRSNLN
ncbi:L,D-transpeptidase family protein [Metabacillus litoralis]|uniref:L,D-transpeptidase family protein n=1 Tax=Metabacillus litoralis TaxID=152268 RepID=UPI00203F8673|nr:L,D-transpeptidase family protein [Metabacillus litoralis]MCM3162595.1 L,D-transpeptidase family protein [Metabacillus litoralis]MCM3410100.1 L,D-transpeptidase family protein [Metabacillus litoralis]